ncbi:transposase [Candidatus Viridilinea mediisalina]|uniref:transposase n=1 Tax=Candidatus Viridilinea mediisalina TaxID=2024553 RepID=UPI001C2C42FA|nr:transposase [Candidatus Viridilinea mediisalina]
MSTHLPHLTHPQSLTLTLWVTGIVIGRYVGLHLLSTLMAFLMERSVNATRAQLHEWYLDAKDKRGAKQGQKRREIAVTTCFAPLMRWVVSLFPDAVKELQVAMDASSLGQRFTVLSIHVVIRGCAIPVAWKIVCATAKGAWRPHWEALFKHLEGSVPSEWKVIVMADRGLYAKWLYDTIVGIGWHPYLRINRQGKYRPIDEQEFKGLSTAVTKDGPGWKGRVVCFATKERQVTCTLLARWDSPYTDPWLILTDLAPDEADVAWYRLRAWIECSYKDMKRGGWHWEQTRMTDPARAERIWLAMAVATLLVVSMGIHDEVTTPEPNREHLSPKHIAHQRKSDDDTPQPRRISCFQRGRLLFVVALIHGRDLPPMALVPEPLPKSLDTSDAAPSAAPPHQKAA